MGVRTGRVTAEGPVDELLAELDRRIAAVRCLPPPTRALVRAWAGAQTDPEIVRDYTDRVIGFVEALERDTGPAFERLCAEVADEHDPNAVLAHFGFRGDYDTAGWLGAEALQTSDTARTFCIANKFALMLPEDADALRAALAESRPTTLFLRASRDPAAALRWGEAELELTADSYRDHAELGARVCAGFGAFEGPSHLMFVALVAERLLQAGRTADAVALIDAPLWHPDAPLPPTARDVGARLHARCEALADALPELPPDAEPDVVERVDQFRALFARVVANATVTYVDVRARIDAQAGAHERALAAVAAVLGLWPAPQHGFDTVSQLRALLPTEGLRRLMSIWSGALVTARKLPAANDAVAALFASDLVAGDDGAPFPAVWRGPDADAAASVLLALAEAQTSARDAPAGLTLFARALGLPRAAFDDPAALGALVADRFAGLAPSTVLCLAGALQLQMFSCGRALDGLAAAEVILGLGPDTYVSSDALRERLVEFWSGPAPSATELLPLLRMSVQLHLNGRSRHGLRLVFALNPDLCDSWNLESYERVRRWLGDLPATLVDEFITNIGTVLRATAPHVALDLMVAHLGLLDTDPDDRPALAAALHKRRRDMPPTAWAVGASGLVFSALLVSDMFENPAAVLDRAIAVAEEALGIGPGWYPTGAQLAPPSGWAGDRELWSLLASEINLGLTYALVARERFADAIRLIDYTIRSLIGLSYRSRRFARELASTNRGPLHQSGVMPLLPMLFTALERDGRTDELHELAADLIEAPDWFRPGSRHVTGVSWLLVDSLLPVLARRDPPAALRMARRFVPAFRAFGLRGDVTGIDRVQLIQFTRDVRHNLIQTGYDAVASDPTGGAALRLETLCWDAELGQLMLRERFDRQPPREPVVAAALPAALPFAPDPALDGPGGAAAALRAPGGAVSPAALWLEGPPAAPVEDGVTPEALAAALDPDERLLRIGFATDGRLVWTLFATTGTALGAIADERAAGAPPDARARLVAAVRAHDDAVAAAWALYHARDAELAAGFARLAAVRPDRADDQFRKRDAARARLLDAHRAALDAATARFLTDASAALALDPLAALIEPHHDLVVQMDDVLHAVPFAFLTVGGKFLFERARTVRVALSVSVNDELKYLDNRLANPSWFGAEPGGEPDVAARAVGLSWAEPGDRAARRAARAFHRGLAGVAAESGLEYRGAGEDPAGTHAALAAELARGGSVPVLAVLGHGLAAHAGVRLADGLWTGAELRPEPPEETVAACDLSAVEFLIQVSCSVGRVHQSGARDVDGFCANLVVGRARSAVAGLWDLLADDAAEIATDFARRYLVARRALDEDRRRIGFGSFDAHRPRGAAVAGARRAWRAANPGPVPARLNTMAAFELYGRG